MLFFSFFTPFSYFFSLISHFSPPHSQPQSNKKAPAPEVNLTGSIHVARSEINLIEIIGTGLYATVWRAQCRGTMVAVKIPKDINRESLAMVPTLIQEMSSLRSPDILSLIGVCVEEEEVLLLTELMTGNLRKLLQSRTPLSLSLCLCFALDVATGMQYLHGSNIAHGDLKSSNVLYEKQGEDYVVRVSDFGLAKLFSTKFNAKAIGTPFYTAPEVLAGADPTKESDVYSFGILLSEIITRKQPFASYQNYEIFKKSVISQAIRPSLPADCPSGLAELVKECWDQNPQKRPQFVDIKPVG
jgi:serine/threonine protein kinase